MKKQAWVLSCLLLASHSWCADVTAVLKWSDAQELGVPVNGVVAEAAIKTGQTVKKGDQLLNLDQAEFRARVRAARAALTLAKLEQVESEREWERTRELYDQVLISEHELQVGEIQRARGASTLEAASLHLLEAELELRRSKLVAPFDGIVLALRATPGQAVVNKMSLQPLVRLAATSTITAVGCIDLTMAKRISAPGEVVLRSGDERLAATAIRIMPAVANGYCNGTGYRLESDFPNASQTLVAGSVVTLSISDSE